MKYVATEPHRVARLLTGDEKKAALAALPVADRRDARLMSFCADCRGPVVMDKLGRFRHVA